MSDWTDIKSLLSKGQPVYLTIKCDYAASWRNELINICKNLDVDVDSVIKSNEFLKSNKFNQSMGQYAVIAINASGGDGGSVPGPGTEPTDPGDYTFSIENNVCPLPAGSYSISQEYGTNGHGGTDMACVKGTDVMAVQAGSVVTVQNWDGVTLTGNMSWGNMIVVQHVDDSGSIYYSLYAHNSQLLVSVGQTVNKGEVIAKSGNTGNVYGAHGGYHLHLEIWVGGYGTAYRVNPRNYVKI